MSIIVRINNSCSRESGTWGATYLSEIAIVDMAGVQVTGWNDVVKGAMAGSICVWCV